MKTLKLLLLMAMVVAFASTAMATTVQLTGAVSGTYTLGSINISNDTITLNVIGTTPGELVLSLNPTTLPAGIVNQAYSQNVTMTASGGTSPYTYSCSGSGVAGLSASKSGATCSVSGTPTASGNYTVNFGVTDAASGSASSSISFNIGTTTPPPPPPSGINMTTTGLQPLYLSYQPVAGLGAANYYAIINQNYAKVTVSLESQDWDATDEDLIISNVRQPLCSEIIRGSWSSGTNGLWFGPIIGRSNETITMRTTIPAGTTIYATVCNFTASVTGKFRISWSGAQ